MNKRDITPPAAVVAPSDQDAWVKACVLEITRLDGRIELDEAALWAQALSKLDRFRGMPAKSAAEYAFNNPVIRP